MRVPPEHQGVHAAGRRPHGHGQGRREHLGGQVQRRGPPRREAHRAGRRLHGQQRAQHERVAVLHHLRQAPAPRQQLCAPPRPKAPPATFAPALFSAADATATLPAPDSVFGKVIDGFDTLDALERCQVNEKHRPLSEIRLQSVTVHANPLAVRSSSTRSAAAAPRSSLSRTRPSRVAGPDDRLPVRQRPPGHSRVTEYGGQKGAVAAPGQQPPRGCRRQAWRCAAVGLAATAPRPRPRRRTGTRPTGHSREPSDRRHRNLAARRPLDRLTGPSLQAQRSTQQSGRGSACVLEARGAAAPRPGRPGPRRACAAVNSCAKSNSAAGFELSLRTWFSKKNAGAICMFL